MAQAAGGTRGWMLTFCLVATAACAPDTIAPPQAGPASSPASEIAPGPYTPGQSYFGRNNYIEYIAGNAPVIYSAPHGGALTPSEIADRTGGSCGGDAVTTKDLNTAELVEAMQSRHFALHGNYPHIIINRLHRKKLDANRSMAEGACGDAEAEIAWNEFHDFIDVAKSAVLAASGKGWYMDMHGHGHSIQRLELGYLLSGATLRLSDAQLDASASYEQESSIQTTSAGSPISFSTLLRGANSLGTLYEQHGIPAVPSAPDPYPESGESYFSGGYNTDRHGCGNGATALGGTSGGNICGVQIEANYTGVRDSHTSRVAFADATAEIVGQYLGTHWGLSVGSGTQPPPSAGISLSVAAARVKGSNYADLTWSGATGATVDVYRDGSLLLNTANDGAHRDALGKVSATFTYKVCEAGTSTCSADASVTVAK